MLRALLACFVAAASLHISEAEADSKLVFVYAVNRHGARNGLLKSAALQDAAVRPRGDVTLLPLVRAKRNIQIV